MRHKVKNFFKKLLRLNVQKQEKEPFRAKGSNKRKHFLQEDLSHALLGQGVVAAHSEGYGFVDLDPKHNPLKKEGIQSAFLSPEEMRNLLHGDEVLVYLFPSKGGRYRASVKEMLTPFSGLILGSLKKNQEVWRFYAAGKFRSLRVSLAPMDEKALDDLIERQKVSKLFGRIRLHKHPYFSRAQGELVHYFAPSKFRAPAVERAIDAFSLRTEFPEEALLEANDAKPLPPKELESYYQDLQSIPFITIDGDDSKDFDDAVYAKKVDSGFSLFVAIADVSHYVPLGSSLDEEAFLRGNSNYFPDRVIPMLPEVLSNGLCSINPSETRLSMVCQMNLDSKGELLSQTFVPALIRSHSRQTYTKVSNLLEGTQSIEEISLPPQALDSLKTLETILGLRLKSRRKRGALELETPERKFVLNEEGRLSGLKFEHRRIAHLMIEEAMILANVATAVFLETHFKEAAIYRTHEVPSEERFFELSEKLRAFGAPQSLFTRSPEEAKDFAPIIQWIHEQESPYFLNVLLIRSMAKARYSAKRSMHFGLALTHYTHFTSPIRRYSDLVAHRLIKAALGLPGFSPLDSKVLLKASEQASKMEVNSADAGYAVADGLKCMYMKEFEGQTLQGTLSTIKKNGVFVVLENGFDGFLPLSSFGHVKLEGAGALITSHEKIRLGDSIEVVLSSVDFVKERLLFSLPSEEKPASSEGQEKTKRRTRKRTPSKQKK